MLLKLFQKIKKKGMLSNLFCDASITLIPKLGKTLGMKEERDRKGAEGGKEEGSDKPMSLMNIDAKSITKF